LVGGKVNHNYAYRKEKESRQKGVGEAGRAGLVRKRSKKKTASVGDPKQKEKV